MERIVIVKYVREREREKSRRSLIGYVPDGTASVK